MYRLTLMYGKWVGIKMDVNDVFELWNKYSVHGLDNSKQIKTLVNEGNPTIIVQDLEDLPNDFKYQII